MKNNAKLVYDEVLSCRVHSEGYCNNFCAKNRTFVDDNKVDRLLEVETSEPIYYTVIIIKSGQHCKWQER